MACRWWWCTCKYDEFNAMHTAIQPPLYSSFVLLRYLFFSSLLLFVSSVLFICFIIWIPFCPMILTCVRSIKVKSLHSLFSCYYSTQHVCEWHQFFFNYHRHTNIYFRCSISAYDAFCRHILLNMCNWPIIILIIPFNTCVCSFPLDVRK